MPRLVDDNTRIEHDLAGERTAPVSMTGQRRPS